MLWSVLRPNTVSEYLKDPQITVNQPTLNLKHNQTKIFYSICLQHMKTFYLLYPVDPQHQRDKHLVYASCVCQYCVMLVRCVCVLYFVGVLEFCETKVLQPNFEDKRVDDKTERKCMFDKLKQEWAKRLKWRLIDQQANELHTRTHENVERMRTFVRGNWRLAFSFIAGQLYLREETVRLILTENPNMTGVPRRYKTWARNKEGSYQVRSIRTPSVRKSRSGE